MTVSIPDDLVTVLNAARHVVMFTGAGVSAESGVPTFRDALTGLWQRYDAEELATAAAFRRDPELVWGWYEWRRARVGKAEPNAAHRAIAAMVRHVPRLTLVTQNVDALHERAGSAAPIHLHGSLGEPRCFDCGHPAQPPSLSEDEPEGGRRLAPPRCGECGGPIRPGVVWFGEPLPDEAWNAAVEATDDCDVLISVGTSSLVYPAAELPLRAARRGAVVVQINPNSTSLDRIAHFNLMGAAGMVLPELVRVAWGA